MSCCFPVIGVVGPQASGKTKVASWLSDLGASRVRMGDLVWREVERRDLEVTEENVGKVAKELREEEGMAAVAKLSIPVISEEGESSSPVVVDGIRGIAEVDKFKEEFGDDFVLVSVEASKETRYERIKNRKREDDTPDFESFEEKDEREKSWGLDEATEAADYTIVNESSLRELESNTIEIFEEIMDRYEG